MLLSCWTTSLNAGLELNQLPKNGVAVKSYRLTFANAIYPQLWLVAVEVLTGFKFIAEKIQEYEETGAKTSSWALKNPHCLPIAIICARQRMRFKPW